MRGARRAGPSDAVILGHSSVAPETMLIREAKPDTRESKELKVKIPVTHHIKLHSMKVLTGKQISETVRDALDAYFHAPPDGLLGLDMPPPETEAEHGAPLP